MIPTDLAALSARDLALAIRQGRISATEATQAAIDRAQAANPVLNAFVSIEADEALDAARAWDASGRPARPDPSPPLGGVPLAHKDMFDRAGKIATWGAALRAEHPPARDATVLARLSQAGAIGFGALAMAEFAFGITGHNYHLGHCRNPHDPTRIAGGSSSGSAAAVAAGIVPFALGSDTGGSVRMPAACCGIAGLRPTWGLISRAGAMPLSPSLDTVGVLARDVGDIALALSLLAGADPRDATAAAPAADYDAALGAPPRGLRIGVDESLLATAESGVAAALEKSLDALRATGATLVAVTLPDLGEIDRYAQLLQFAEASAAHAHWMRTRPDAYSEQVRARLETGYAIAAVDYLQALRARPTIAARVIEDGALARADALFLPILDRPLPTIAETDVGGSADMAATLGALLRLTRPIGYLGVPSLALPTRPADGPLGLPNGFQLVGRPYAEPTLLTLGAAYQAETGVPRPVPSGQESPLALRL